MSEVPMIMVHFLSSIYVFSILFLVNWVSEVSILFIFSKIRLLLMFLFISVFSYFSFDFFSNQLFIQNHVDALSSVCIFFVPFWLTLSPSLHFYPKMIWENASDDFLFLICWGLFCGMQCGHSRKEFNVLIQKRGEGIFTPFGMK